MTDTPRGLTRTQIARMLEPVRADRVEQVQGRSYVPAHEVRAELSRTFGPTNWDSEASEMKLLYETEETSADGKKKMWRVAYSCKITLRVRDYWGNELCRFTEYHAEECAPNPSRGEAHSFAMTSVESYALRRAAIGLGDNFGLHLYDNGSLAKLVKGTLALTSDPDAPLYQAPPAEAEKPAEKPAAPRTRAGKAPVVDQATGEVSEAPAAPSINDAFKKPTAAAAKPKAAAS